MRICKCKLVLLAGGLLFLAAFLFYMVRNPSWSQPTMGTECHITVSGTIPRDRLSDLKEKVEKRLLQVNQCMSTWQSNTEVSLFNVTPSVQIYSVSPEFGNVVRSALEIAERTDGAFDPTVKPLVDYWGFGPEERTLSLDETRQKVGWQKLSVFPGSIQKRQPYLELDLSAIAKGYGVDAVSKVIKSAGYSNFIVEIGGEVRASGLKDKERPWRVGIELPEPGTGFGEQIHRAIELNNEAMATSGGYRNFKFREDGSVYSHIIDPVSGMPAESDVASVTVISPTCMEADAVATALFVMGSEKGLPWVEAQLNVEAHFILHSTNQTFTSCASSGFPEK